MRAKAIAQADRRRIERVTSFRAARDSWPRDEGPFLQDGINADRAALHTGGPVALCLHRLPARHERDPQSGRLDRVQARRDRGARELVPGRVRRAGAEVFPQGRRAGAAEEGRGERRSRPGSGAPCPTRPRWPSCPRPSATAPRSPPSRSSTASPAAGPIGAGRAAISPPRRTRTPSTTSCASCSPPRWWRRTRRNGSTPACTGPTASTARARATSTSITRPAS